MAGLVNCTHGAVSVDDVAGRFKCLLCGATGVRWPDNRLEVVP